MITLPITKHAKKQEWKTILTTAHNNGFPAQIIHNLRKKLETKTQQQQQTTTQPNQNNKKWITFTYHSPSKHKFNNLFKRTNLKVAFRTTNTICQQLSNKFNIPNSSGIYELKCNTCNHVYVGLSSRTVTMRHREHLHYIRKNNPTSAYAMHIRDNRHEFGPTEETLKLLKPCHKGRMDCRGGLVHTIAS
jgi:hypothetical protein